MTPLPPILTVDQMAKLQRVMDTPPTGQYMQAGRADAIPADARMLWYVRKVQCPISMHWPAGSYTALLRYTNSTLYNGGETVMADNPVELSKHLNAAMRARGRVLVTGLGLGCVVRMLQCNPLVESITVIEISQQVIELVWPHTSHDRVELVHADAIDYLRKTKRTWDCAWHDIWTDTDNDQPHLAVVHQWLMFLCAGRVHRQGAWAFPRAKKTAVDRVIEQCPAKRVRHATRKFVRQGWAPAK